MNTVFSILLGVIMIVLLYLVYVYYFSTTTTLTSSLWLNQNNAPITTIVNPQSSIFTYGVWVYINTWSQGPTNLFQCSTGSQTHFSLDFPVASPTLTCTVNTGPTACNPSSTPTVITVTNNFGIQRWVYVLVSVNTNIVDCYLDGKLVTSTQLNGIPTISCTNANNNWSIQYGTGDIYLSNFQRWTTATDPASAMSYYRVKPAAAKVFSSYGANIQLTKDNVGQQSIKLF
jgi:hypothetical protein